MDRSEVIVQRSMTRSASNRCRDTRLGKSSTRAGAGRDGALREHNQAPTKLRPQALFRR